MSFSWFLLWSAAQWGLRLAMVPVILRRRFGPSTALTWLSLIFFWPELGIALYLLIGSHRLGRKRVRLHRQVVEAMRADELLATRAQHRLRPDLDPAQLPVILLAQKIGRMPAVGGNQVDLLTETQGTIDRLVADIDAAQHHVHLLFYIFAPDATGRRVVEALVRAQARGVPCRVLADAVGSRPLFKHALYRTLADAGIPCHAMLRVNIVRRRLRRLDLRNHRKLAIIDGQVAYTGSQNLVDADYGRRDLPWLDLMGRFMGPVVDQFAVVFLEDWAFETGEMLQGLDLLPPQAPAGKVAAQVVATGPGSDTRSLPRVLLAAVSAAQRQIIITSPYLVPDEPMLIALCMAAQRDVEVRIVVPQRINEPLVAAASRSYFEPLLRAGVRLHLHQRGMLHAKTMTVDDSFALLGSSNLDVRSFHLNFEVNVLLYGPHVTGLLRQAQMRYVDESVRVNRKQWRRRPALARYRDSAAALLSPLL